METLTLSVAVDEEQNIELLKSMCRAIEAHLRGAKERLNDEIRSYPTPIPRCDAQFNHLYERRGRISADLEQIAALCKGNASREEYVELIRQYLAPAR